MGIAAASTMEDCHGVDLFMPVNAETAREDNLVGCAVVETVVHKGEVVVVKTSVLCLVPAVTLLIAAVGLVVVGTVCVHDIGLRGRDEHHGMVLGNGERR
jgi:hypothetical protein